MIFSSDLIFSHFSFFTQEQFKEVLSEVMLARNSYARGNSLVDQIEPREFEESLLSARINLLFRALAISS